ncbi:hypothetical protein A3K55_02445 [Candidatus Shapirobacteria bacterium RBG_13_44_7]|uniref:Uncharacterized protein n=1 Tax=Candidatus Shapirobacteria bacterium RBG_13_44_7 TaxID=1802149 RepID=A0A1F7SM46_9BACT|nr:MAG: hypothetical protein A3K55_02445 [Candidatus Shapirobacteria bacterium RBG_13_44_7]
MDGAFQGGLPGFKQDMARPFGRIGMSAFLGITRECGIFIGRIRICQNTILIGTTTHVDKISM